MEQEYIKNELVKFNLPEAAIAQLSKDYMPLVIKGVDDKIGYKAVHEARMVVVRKRNEIEKKRKELKEDALKFGKAVDGEAKRLTGLLQPIEDHLTKEQKAVDDYQKRLKEEAEKQEQERILARTNLLFEGGCRFNGITYSYGTFMVPQSIVATVDDTGFEVILKELREILTAELKQKEAEEAAAEAERKRMAEERLAQETERKRLEVESARLRAEHEAAAKKLSDDRMKLELEKKALEDAKNKEEAEKRRLQELKDAEEMAAARALAKKVEEERIAKEKADKEAAEKAKKEARKPDKAKLLAWADKIAEIAGPAMKTKEGDETYLACHSILMAAVRDMRVKIKEL